MVEGSDPNSTQAWLVAIPSLITALSTWYMSRKTTKVGSAAEAHTKRVVTESSEETMQEVMELKRRVNSLEVAVNQVRDGQKSLSQGYSVLMARIDAKSMTEEPEAKQTQSPGPASVIDSGKEKMPDPKATSFGKVILKP